MTVNHEGPVVPEITVGMRLDIAMRHAGIKSGELADELGIDRGTVSRWINDRHKRPIPRLYLKTIALRCGVPFEWLESGISPTTAGKCARSRGGRFRSPVAA